tara:strand:+ start:1323 stop:1949 length:627 start_codon:yes stop_codon:yes gene_type:complete
MKLLLEKWSSYLNEQSVPYEEIQAIIDGNQYLKGKIVASEETVYDLGDKYFLMSGVSHIAKRHKDKCFPGSLFLQGDDLVKEAVLNIVRGMDPTAGKVLAVPSSVDGLGMERLVKTTPEEIAGLEDYKMNDGTLVKIKKEGQNPGQATDRLTVIAPSIGDAGGKPVLSLVTAFPGFMGTGKGGEGDIEIKDRADFTKNGYYFLVPEGC